MPEDFRDYIQPIQGTPSIDRLEGPPAPPERPRMPRSIAGRIVGVNRGRRHQGEAHRLDITVGAGEFTEIIVRVPNGVYDDLEGKRAVMYIDD
jgi:hypothetical protein